MNQSDLQILQGQVGLVDVYETHTYGCIRKNPDGEIIGDLSIEVRDHGAAKAPGRYTAFVSQPDDRSYAGKPAESIASAVADAIYAMDIHNPPRVATHGGLSFARTGDPREITTTPVKGVLDAPAFGGIQPIAGR